MITGDIRPAADWDTAAPPGASQPSRRAQEPRSRAAAVTGGFRALTFLEKLLILLALRIGVVLASGRALNMINRWW